MATPTPQPATPDPTPPAETPAAAPALVMPSGPACTGCGDEAVVHWRRRPTDEELAELVGAEESRRADRRTLADPQQAAPTFPPLPTSADTTRTVYACARHAITLDGAARIHQATCTAPNEQHLPDCDCTPEPAAADRPEPDSGPPAPSRLPEHWITGGP